MKSPSHGPEPCASANSAISACAELSNEWYYTIYALIRQYLSGNFFLLQNHSADNTQTLPKQRFCPGSVFTAVYFDSSFILPANLQRYL